MAPPHPGSAVPLDGGNPASPSTASHDGGNPASPSTPARDDHTPITHRGATTDYGFSIRPFAPHRGWYSRGYLPHRDHSGLLQAITYRLIDSLPAAVVAELDRRLRALPPEQVDPAQRKRVDGWLDAGHGCCVLRNPEAAACVVDTWRRFDGERYDLIAWVVMPNHVHVLVRTYDGVALATIVQSWKSYTGKWIKRLLNERRQELDVAPWPFKGLWMREYWDRFIRDERHFNATVNYIHQNPVKAGLVQRAEDWVWSSVHEFGGG